MSGHLDVDLASSRFQPGVSNIMALVWVSLAWHASVLSRVQELVQTLLLSTKCLSMHVYCKTQINYIVMMHAECYVCTYLFIYLGGGQLTVTLK